MSQQQDNLGWVDTVFTDWPGPIAHEYRRLADLMPRARDAAAEPNYQVLAAFLQLRDFTEVLVKLPAIVMLRDADRLNLDVTRIKGLLLGTPPSLGSWLQVATHLARQLRSHEQCLTSELVAMFLNDRKKPTGLSLRLEKLVGWRNQELGHGALRMDLDALAAEIAELIVALNRDLADAAEREPWKHLFIRLDGHDDVLVGCESIRRHHDRTKSDQHDEHDAALICSRPNTRYKLNLAPYAAARVCTTTGCNKQDVFFYNRRSIGTATQRVQYLDYMMGHALLEPQAKDRKWAKEVSDLKGARAGSVVGEKWTADYLQELLDSTDLSREYVEPAYLVDEVRDFLATHDRGIFWLRAPAHTGKTVFASHAADLLADEPGDVLIASLLIKREYRFGLGMFNTFIEKTFHAGRTSQYQRKFRWQERSDESMPECFIQEAAELVELARALDIAHDRVLLILDGMDELPAPGAYGEASDLHSIADLLPPADSLPAGMYLLLTSRPESANETPAWVLDRLRTVTNSQRNARTFDINRDTDSYRRLLRRCFDDQRTKKTWKAGKIADPDELFATIGDRADWTFLYFSHLLRLLRDGVIPATDLTGMKQRGERLFFAYLDRLASLLGEKEYERVRELLLVLAACEEAHAQAAVIVPPMFFDPQWEGVPLDALAGLMHELCEDSQKGKHPAGVPHRLLFVLQSVSDILRSYRSSDTHASYAIGLKGLVQAMREDHSPGGWAQRLDETHHRLVRDAIAAENTFASQPEEEDCTASEHYLFWKGWCHARVLLSLGTPESNAEVMETLRAYPLPCSLLIDVAEEFYDDWEPCHACESLSIAIDHISWHMNTQPHANPSSDAETLARAYGLRASIRSGNLDRDGADDDYEQATAIIDREMALLGQRAPWSLRYGRAITLMNYGAHLAEFGATGKAFEAFGAAVSRFRAIRRATPAAKQQDVIVRLASAFMNRGQVRSECGDLAAAQQDLNHAIELLTALRTNRKSRWDPELCSGLASSLTNRAHILEQANSLASAVRDFNAAINLCKAFIVRHEDDVAFDFYHELARAYTSRAGLTGIGTDPALRLKDFGQALTILRLLSEFPHAECPPDVLDSLAMAYRNRAQAHAEAGHFRRAIADYGRAITTFESIGKKLGGQIPPEINENIAELHQLRATVREEVGNKKGVSADLNSAVACLDNAIRVVRAASGNEKTHWVAIDRFVLARCLTNRSNIRFRIDDKNGSLRDGEQAIALLNGFLANAVHASHHELECWLDIADVAFATRADVHDDAGDYATAVSEYNDAIEVMESLGTRLGARRGSEHKSTLCKAYAERAKLHEKRGDTKAAAADRRRADGLTF